MNAELRTIHLHGSLGEQFGKTQRLAVKSPSEAVRALAVLFKGFRQAIVASSWHVILGVGGASLSLGEEDLHLGAGKADIHIVPAAEGAGGAHSGGMKIIIGVALIAVSIATSGALTPLLAGEFGAAGAAMTGVYAMGAMLGASLILTGISQLIAPTPAAQSSQSNSFSLIGPGNTNREGGPIPVIYGTVRCGSVVGAATMSTSPYPFFPYHASVTILTGQNGIDFSASII